MRFRSRELGQRFYNGLIFGRDGWKEPEGGLHGPGGESWYRNGRHGEWRRDDDRRKRDPLPADEEAGAK